MNDKNQNNKAPIIEIKDDNSLIIENNDNNELFNKKNILIIVIILFFIIFFIFEIIKLNNSHKEKNIPKNNNINNTIDLNLEESIDNVFDGTFNYFKDSIDDIISLEMPTEFVDKTAENHLKTFEYIYNKQSIIFKIMSVQNYNNSSKLANEFHDLYKDSSKPSNKTINNITWYTVRKNGLLSSNKYYFAVYKKRLYKIEMDFTNEELLNKFEEQILNGISFKY